MSCVEEVTVAIDRLAPLPTVARRLLQIISEPTGSTDELLAVLRSEETLSQRIIKLSNSNIHDPPREITDISETVAYLGAGNLIRMIVCLCVSPYYQASRCSDRNAVAEAWRHSVACGIGAELLADASGVTRPGAAFAAGTLHNIGKLPLLSVATKHREALRAGIDTSRRSCLEVEREVLGVDHAAAGSTVADRWGLPANLRQAIRNHHNPEFMSVDDELTALVHVSDILSVQLGIGVEGLGHSLCPDSIRRIHLRRPEIDGIRISILDQLRRAQDLLKLAASRSR